MVTVEEQNKILDNITESQAKIIAQEKELNKQAKKLSSIESLLRKLLSKKESITLEEEKIVSSELNFFQRYFVNKSRKHKIAVQIIIVLAIVMVWRGLWDLFDQLPVISSAIISLILGLFLLWIFNRFSDLN